MHYGCSWEKFAMSIKVHLCLFLQESTLVKCSSQSNEETVSKVWRLILSKGSELLWGDKSMPSLEVIKSQCCDMMAFETNTVCVCEDGREIVSNAMFIVLMRHVMSMKEN